ncbi:MAG: DUF1629 domain-containing protein [Paracoccaceae bacterium]
MKFIRSRKVEWMMGAVVSNDIFETDNANLVHPDGHSVGSAMAVEIGEFRDQIRSQAMVAYAKETMAKGGTPSVYGFDFAAPFRGEIADEMFPKKVLVDTGATLPDYYSNFGFFFVSDAFKSLVEEFDGGQHQFVPVEIVDQSGDPYSKSDFYIFNCRQILNAVDETSETLNFQPSANPQPGDPSPFSTNSGSPFRMFKDKIGSAGIWRELRSLRSTFASEAFWQEAKSRNLSGMMRLTNFEEI